MIEPGSHTSLVHPIPSSHAMEGVFLQFELLHPVNVNFKVLREQDALAPEGPAMYPAAHVG